MLTACWAPVLIAAAPLDVGNGPLCPRNFATSYLGTPTSWSSSSAPPALLPQAHPSPATLPGPLIAGGHPSSPLTHPHPPGPHAASPAQASSSQVPTRRRRPGASATYLPASMSLELSDGVSFQSSPPPGQQPNRRPQPCRKPVIVHIVQGMHFSQSFLALFGGMSPNSGEGKAQCPFSSPFAERQESISQRTTPIGTAAQSERQS